MRGVGDWRGDNKSIPAAAMPSVVVMAMTSGADSAKAVWRFGERPTMAQRRLPCLRHDKDRFGKPLEACFEAPSCVTFYKFLKKPIRDQGLANALVCADALHGRQETARAILDANSEDDGAAHLPEERHGKLPGVQGGNATESRQGLRPRHGE